MNTQTENIQIVVEALEDRNSQIEMLAHFLTILFLVALLLFLIMVLKYRLVKEENIRLRLLAEASEKTNRQMFKRYIEHRESPKFPTDRNQNHNL